GRPRLSVCSSERWPGATESRRTGQCVSCRGRDACAQASRRRTPAPADDARGTRTAMTAIAPQHWLIAFIIAVVAHIVAGATIWAVDHVPPASEHSPQGVMVSLDALTVGNNEAEAI